MDNTIKLTDSTREQKAEAIKVLFGEYFDTDDCKQIFSDTANFILTFDNLLGIKPRYKNAADCLSQMAQTI